MSPPPEGSAKVGPVALISIFAVLLTIIVWRQLNDRVPETQLATVPPALPRSLREEKPQGSVIHLFDISGSTNPGGKETPFHNALPLLDRTIRVLWNLSEVLPQRHVVAVIGENSLGQKPLCDLRLPK